MERGRERQGERGSRGGGRGTDRVISSGRRHRKKREFFLSCSALVKYQRELFIDK